MAVRTLDVMHADGYGAVTEYDPNKILNGVPDVELAPLIKGELSFYLMYALKLATDGKEFDPEMHVYLSHGMSNTKVISLPAGIHQSYITIPVRMKFRHRGPLPADAALHFNLRAKIRHHEMSNSKGQEAQVLRSIGTGFIFLTDIYPIQPTRVPIGCKLLQVTMGGADKGVVAISCIQSDTEGAAARSAESSLPGIHLDEENVQILSTYWRSSPAKRVLAEQFMHSYVATTIAALHKKEGAGAPGAGTDDARAYARTVPLFHSPSPLDLIDSNIEKANNMMGLFIEKSEYNLYVPGKANDDDPPMKPTVNRGLRVHMPRFLSDFLLPTGFYFLPPTGYCNRTREEWLESEPYFLNVLHIVMRRCNTDENEIRDIIDMQFRNTVLLPETRLVELVVQNMLTACATQFPYTDDSSYKYDEATKQWTLTPNDRYGESMLTGTGDCEDVTRIMTSVYFALTNPHFSGTLRALGRFLDLYVPECRLTLVNNKSLNGSSTAVQRNQATVPVLQNSIESEEERVKSSNAHMCLLLVPVREHVNCIKRGKREFKLEVPQEEFETRHGLRHAWTEKLKVIVCEGTGFMERGDPEVATAREDRLDEAAISEIKLRTAARTHMYDECDSTLGPVLRGLGSQTYLQNNVGAVKTDYSDKNYTPFAIFHSHYCEMFTPFWVMRYNILCVKFMIGRQDGGVHRDGVFRTCIPAETCILKDPAVSYRAIEPWTDAMYHIGMKMLEHGQQINLPKLHNGSIYSYLRTHRSADSQTIEAVVCSDDLTPALRKVVPLADVGAETAGSTAHSHNAALAGADAAQPHQAARTVDSINPPFQAHERTTFNADPISLDDTTAPDPADGHKHEWHRKQFQRDMALLTKKVFLVINSRQLTTVIDDYSIRGLITVEGDTIVNARSEKYKAFLRGGTKTAVAYYSEMSNREKRKRAYIDYYYYQDFITIDMVRELIKVIATSTIVEGVHFQPEIFMYSENSEPLNPMVRMRLYHVSF